MKGRDSCFRCSESLTSSGEVFTSHRTGGPRSCGCCGAAHISAQPVHTSAPSSADQLRPLHLLHPRTPATSILLLLLPHLPPHPLRPPPFLLFFPVSPTGAAAPSIPATRRILLVSSLLPPARHPNASLNGRTRAVLKLLTADSPSCSIRSGLLPSSSSGPSHPRSKNPLDI